MEVKGKYQELLNRIDVSETDPMNFTCDPDEKTGRLVCVAKMFQKSKDGKAHVAIGGLTIEKSKENEEGYEIYGQFGSNDVQTKMVQKLREMLP